MILNSLIFILWTAIFWVGIASVAKVFHISTQEGQLLGAWQKQLRAWDTRGDKSGQFYAKIGGYCELCYSHAFSLLGFIIYAFFMNGVLGLWVPGWGGLVLDIVFNLVWFFAFVHTSTILTLFFIVKLFK